jgi:thymidylate kinase
MAKELKYTKTVTTRFPEEVFKAIGTLVKNKQKDFPRYTEADAIRAAIVNHLKSKGYLDKAKNYL